MADPSATSSLSDEDYEMMTSALQLATSSRGLTSPHPYFGCVLARGTQVVGRGHLYAAGTESAEYQAVREAGERSRGSTAYLNMEPGDCHGDDSAIRALVEAGVSRVVMGMRNPFSYQWGRATSALVTAGIHVDILGEGRLSDPVSERLAERCRQANAAVLYRASHKLPFSVLKYAMTLDGKIAASSGHAAWVTSPEARKRVFEVRAQSDAVIVGGNTVRRDNPNLTTRQESGHMPIRIVMSRTLKLPEDANLWDSTIAPTIVMTQRGARGDFQERLRKKGCEVVEFDFLNPRAVMEYCYSRGFLQVLWECGGTLSAPAVTANVIHQVMAFVAPKIIGGTTAPSPMGELGFVEMTQALPLSSVSFEQVGPDMLVNGFLQPLPDTRSPAALGSPSEVAGATPVIHFYKAWDKFGAFSNFSSHSIRMPYVSCPLPSATSAEAPAILPRPFMAGGHAARNPEEEVEWKSVEHFYQAQKFACTDDAEAQETVAAILSVQSPEEAAKLGRRLERRRPDLVRPDWKQSKLQVMYEALRKKFTSHSQLAAMLISTANAELVEASPVDSFWGNGRDNMGSNHLGKHLMRLRGELKELGIGAEEQGSISVEKVAVVNGVAVPSTAAMFNNL